MPNYKRSNTAESLRLKLAASEPLRQQTRTTPDNRCSMAKSTPDKRAVRLRLLLATEEVQLGFVLEQESALQQPPFARGPVLKHLRAGSREPWASRCARLHPGRSHTEQLDQSNWPKRVDEMEWHCMQALQKLLHALTSNRTTKKFSGKMWSWHLYKVWYWD